MISGLAPVSGLRSQFPYCSSMTGPASDRNEDSASAPGPVVHTPQGRPYRFDPGVLCLTLLPTGGHSGYARYEVLHTPADPIRCGGRGGARWCPRRGSR
ncbi:hypothetical protein [Streptomyces sp. NBC_01320]|uniref:hypothetical protein n=1 Tax=Streptomyces sp. NBC_01320 TaxID=2903824 RepID=UPI002E113559